MRASEYQQGCPAIHCEVARLGLRGVKGREEREREAVNIPIEKVALREAKGEMAVVKCPYCGQVMQWVMPRQDYVGLEHCSHCGENYRVKYGGNVCMYAERRGIEIEIPEALPQNVVDDFGEALACSRVEAYKATVVMCRRGLESLAGELKAKGGHLVQRLEDLKNRGVILESTYNLASGIRQFGNYGAHPQDDLLKDIDKNEATIVLNAAERILREIKQHKTT